MPKILIVDDSPTVQALLVRLLTTNGYQCATASDGDKGYQAAKDEKPDLILMDVVMGQHNGFQTCRKIKKDPALGQIPVVLLTSKTTESDRFWGEQMGASAYLHKPVEPDELLQTIQKLLA